MTYGARHASVRAFERYGVFVDDNDWRGAFLDLTDTLTGAAHNAIMLRRFSDGSESWIVRVRGVAMIAIYKPEHAVFGTVLAAPS